MAVYDATSAEARKYYWDLVNKGLFSIGADAWWMDTTEPETEGQEENILLDHKLAAGSGNRYVNAYPLLDTQADLSRAARGLRQEARVYSFALGIRRIAAECGDGVVGRHQL